MCAKCQRIFDQPSYDEVLAQIPEEWEDEVHRRIQEKSTLELAAASLKKTHPIKRYGRDWCVSLVVEVDERRWRRAHGLLD